MVEFVGAIICIISPIPMSTLCVCVCVCDTSSFGEEDDVSDIDYLYI